MATHRAVNKGYEYENPVDSIDNEMNSSRPSGSKGNVDNEQPNTSQTDHLNLKGLNANNYATRKTVAQGMLDLALLSANATQLKFILQMGPTYDFYTLLLSLVIVSIILQLLQAVICVILGVVLDINKIDEQRSADICNNICLVINVATVVVNIIVSAFEMTNLSELNT